MLPLLEASMNGNSPETGSRTDAPFGLASKMSMTASNEECQGTLLEPYEYELMEGNNHPPFFDFARCVSTLPSSEQEVCSEYPES